MFLKAPNSPGLGLSLRLSLWYGILLTGCVLLSGMATYRAMRNFIIDREVVYLQNRVTEYREYLINNDLPALQNRFNDLQGKERDGFFLRVIQGDDQVILYSNLPHTFAMLTRDQIRSIPTTPGLHNFTIRPDPDNSRWTLFTVQINDHVTLQAGKNSNEVSLILNKLRTVFVKFILPLLILTVAGGAAITYLATRPLRDLNNTIQRILSEGNFDARVPLRSATHEFAALSAGFNRMLEKISRLMQLLRETVDNAAHDLRTPLTRLRNAAEDALDHGKTEDELREGLSDCLEESDRVLNILALSMEVAEAKSGNLRIDLVPVDLRAACARAVELYEIVAEEKNITLTLTPGYTPRVMADPVRLNQILANLVDNAIKYGNPGGTVTLDIARDNTLTVADTGIGIAPEDLPRIWDRSFRADHSRTRRGAGLGLSLVQALVTACAGTITVESKLNHGTVFTLRFPAAAGKSQNPKPKSQKNPKS